MNHRPATSLVRHQPSGLERRASSDRRISAETFTLPAPPVRGQLKKGRRLIIEHGATNMQAENFQQFRRYYDSVWSRMVTLLESIERLLRQFSVPMAIIAGDR